VVVSPPLHPHPGRLPHIGDLRLFIQCIAVALKSATLGQLSDYKLPEGEPAPWRLSSHVLNLEHSM